MAESWEPNQEYLHTLVSMGISHSIALQALFCTGNKSIDEAVDYVFNNQEEFGHSDSESTNITYSKPQDFAGLEIERDEDEDMQYFKMIFVTNISLKMGVGKIAAQVGHACLGLYRKLLKDHRDELYQWERLGEKKIVLKGNDETHLLDLMDRAKANKIPCYLVRDAGHTQIAPNSVTVLSLFGLEEKVNDITGKLNLL